MYFKVYISKTKSLFLPLTKPLPPPVFLGFKKCHLFPSCSGQKVGFMIKSCCPSAIHQQILTVSSTFKPRLKSDHYVSPPPYPPQTSLPLLAPCLNSGLQSLSSHFRVILIDGNHNRYRPVVKGKELGARLQVSSFKFYNIVI